MGRADNDTLREISPSFTEFNRVRPSFPEINLVLRVQTGLKTSPKGELCGSRGIIRDL